MSSDARETRESNQHFLIVFKSWATRRSPYLGLLSEQESMARQVVGSRWKYTISTLQMDTVLNQFLMTHSWLSQPLIREASIHSRWQLTQKPTTRQHAETETIECSALNDTNIYWKLKYHCRKSKQECKSQRHIQPQGDSVLWTQEGS